MFFMIHATYAQNSPALWSEYLDAHVEYLTKKAEIILAAGGLLDDDGERTAGALYIIEAADRAQATDFIEADPFVRGGIIDKFEIVRWRKSFFDNRHVGGPGYKAHKESN